MSVLDNFEWNIWQGDCCKVACDGHIHCEGGRVWHQRQARADIVKQPIPHWISFNLSCCTLTKNWVKTCDHYPWCHRSVTGPTPLPRHVQICSLRDPQTTLTPALSANGRFAFDRYALLSFCYNYLFSFSLCCISPVLAAKVLKDVEVTVGSDQEEGGRFPYAGTAGAIQKMGAKHVKKDVKISF